MVDQQQGFNEDEAYNQFPAGADDPDGPFGPEQGFNTWARVNDRSLFTEEALAIPAIAAFVDAPFDVTYAQFKSSHRETEYFLHKPHSAMTEHVTGITGTVRHISADDPPTRLPTLVVNHERTLARHILRAIAITDTGTAGQILHKEEEAP
jgi:hypothetical protein